MGTTNHGTQAVSHKYYEEVIANNRNVRLVDIIPRGIYSGGYLEKSGDYECQIPDITVELGDDDVQVRVKTSAVAVINDSTLDSGSISVSTPYIVLRWAYVAVQNNYMEIHAIADVASAQANDIIVGKIIFVSSKVDSFDYSDRTLLNVQNLYLQPRSLGSLYVGLRSGRVHTSTGCVTIQEPSVGPFDVPAYPSNRIDLIYVDDNGVPQILKGTLAVVPVVPSYAGKLVIAEVTVGNGVSSILASKIKDVRAFLTPQSSIPNNSVTVAKLKRYDSGWFAIGTSVTYTKAHGLGAEPPIVLVYIAEYSNGSGRRASANGSTDVRDIGSYPIGVGTTICKVDATNVKIRTGSMSVAHVFGESGVLWNPTSAYARIIAIE
jgi:hypothetical protein